MAVYSPVLTQEQAQEESGALTAEAFFALGETVSSELIDGRVVQMSPTGGRHGAIEARLARLLDAWVSERNLGFVMSGEVGLITQRNPDRVRGVDLAFWPTESLPDGPPQGFVEAAPYLAIEIVSPGNSWEEIRQKISEYFQIGVARVWLIEPDNRAALVYRNATEYRIFSRQETLPGDGPLAGFSVRLAGLFG